VLDVLVDEGLEKEIIECAETSQVCFSRVRETSIDVLLTLDVLRDLVSQGLGGVLELDDIIDDLIAELLHLLKFRLCRVDFLVSRSRCQCAHM